MDDAEKTKTGPVTPSVANSPANPGGTNRGSSEEATTEAKGVGDRAPGEIAPADVGDRAPGEENTEEVPQATYQSAADVAKEVAQGRWGVGQSRRSALKRAGYDPNEVEAEVIKILNKR